MAYIHCLIYPTWYHFIASILVLYIVYYILRRVQMRLNIQTIWLLLLTLAVYLTAYLLWCDKSYYHIDDVEEKNGADSVHGLYARRRSLQGKLRKAPGAHLSYGNY